MISPNDPPPSQESIQLFPLGRVVATPGALAAIPTEQIHAALRRHVTGDWGEVGEEDWAENQLSLDKGFRLFSVYLTSNNTRFWIITESDRSATTVLLPDEY